MRTGAARAALSKPKAKGTETMAKIIHTQKLTLKELKQMEINEPFEHENDEPAFLLANASAIAFDLWAWRTGDMTAEQFEDAWGYDDPERAHRGLIKAMATRENKQ